ncbi:MAG: hypothetical protein JW709_11180 [Sedimentisphaerales bacterium]|nr:hypothetical protein [Sedimentisphaerales bacterium]
MSLSDCQLGIIQLRWDEKDRKVVITTHDGDKFVTTVDQAIFACKAADKREIYKKQFNNLLDKLGGWLQHHKKTVFEAFLTIRDAGLLFVPIKNTPQYDPAWEDELTDLDLEIAQDDQFDVIRLSVLSLPKTTPEAISTFLSTDIPPLHYQNAQ